MLSIKVTHRPCVFSAPQTRAKARARAVTRPFRSFEWRTTCSLIAARVNARYGEHRSSNSLELLQRTERDSIFRDDRSKRRSARERPPIDLCTASLESRGLPGSTTGPRTTNSLLSLSFSLSLPNRLPTQNRSSVRSSRSPVMFAAHARSRGFNS